MTPSFRDFYAPFFRGEWAYHGMGDSLFFTSRAGLCGEFAFSAHPASDLDGPAHTYLRSTVWLSPEAKPHPDRVGELYHGQYRPWSKEAWSGRDEVLEVVEDYWAALGQDALSTAVAGDAWLSMVSSMLHSLQPYFLESTDHYHSYPFLKKRIELLKKAHDVDMGGMVGLDFGSWHG